MRLAKCRGTYDVGQWLLSKGITPSEHRGYGGVDRVHGSTSLHYQLDQKGAFPAGYQGNLALDANDNDVSSEKWGRKLRRKFGLWTEVATLKMAYRMIKRMARRKRWPLDEMFVDGLGFMVEYGYDRNRPIGNHETHLHIGFSRSRW